MNTRRQLLLSSALLGAAVVAVGAYAVTDRQSPSAAAQAGEHDHAAAQPAADGQLRSVRLDAAAAQRIGVTYATVVLAPFAPTVTTVGSVTVDETRLTSVNPKIDGWVEELYADFTGAPVRAGEPLLAVYSPMLVSAQEELILARRLADQATNGGGERAAANARDLLDAARRRLGYWDITADEIARIEQAGVPARTVTLRAPASGVVVEKSVVEGSRIMPGMDIFRIADLSTIWVEGEVFEKDLSLVRVGQGARVTVEAYPGEVFTGTVAYLYPTLDATARTGRVRVELSNRHLRLKPGMYAKLELRPAEPRLALTIPRTAVHWTGERALVFVRHDGGVLMPHEVTTGLAAGDDIEIVAGLEAGMQVVSSANFLVDAESNMGSSLGAMPGMDMGH
jgi:RND family efflux transporter MFP subunit